MGSQYTGDGSAYPVDFTIPDDGDPRDAATVNVAFEALGDRTETIRTKGLIRLVREVFLVGGTWTKPADLANDFIFVEGCGGGGGGGYAAQSTTNSANRFNSGGAGGGGALLRRVTLDISTLATGEDIAVGIGGGGGGGLSLGSPGADGDQSYLDCIALYPNTTFFFPGGCGGASGRETTNADQAVTAIGGPPIVGLSVGRIWQPPTGVGSVGSMPCPMQPGQGGHACTQQFQAFTYDGAPSPTPAQMLGIASGGGGGSKGSFGTTASTYYGGGAGGGGGGGPWGYGGNGGDGGNGNSSGAGTAGTAGNSAPAYSGAGGGGGGAGGYGSTSLGAHGWGGDGGSGRIVIYWWQKGVVLP